MPARAFLDTNILVYAFAADDPRSETAERLLAAGGAISVQVLHEFVNVCRRKLDLDWDGIEERIETLSALLDAPAPITLGTHEAARTLARKERLSFYDALIVAAAQEAGVEALLTEDLQNGRRFGGVAVVNPFAAA